MLIVIIGPDGCGKTTLAEKLVARYRRDGEKAKHLAMHFEILPKLKDLVNPFLKRKIDTSHEEGEFHAGMRMSPHSKLKGSMYVAYYAFDYFLGNAKLWKSRNRNEIIIFARYYNDYYYQRIHKKTPKWFIRMFEIIVPKPDLIITISRSSFEIFKQKPELTESEIERQQNVINQFLSNNENAYVVDGNNGVEKMVEEAHGLIEKLK